jgi:AcrR family transcriptional regulator
MDVMPARETKRSEKKREVILDAATRHFNRTGVRGATLTGIAADVGLVTNSVTYYYRKKEDLAAACLLRAVNALGEIIAQAMKQSTPAARLETLLQIYARRLVASMNGEMPPLMSFNDIRALDNPQAETVFDAYNSMFRQLRELFQAPELAQGRMEQNARTHLLLSLLHATQDWIGRYEVQDYERVAQRIGTILLSGIGGRPVGWQSASALETLFESDEDAPREAFLRVATRLINKQGYRGASVEKIAAELNVTKGSFYHHIDSKDELIVGCFERSFRVIRRAQDSGFAADGNGLDRLTAVTADLIAYQLSDHGPVLRISALNALPETLREKMKITMERLARRYEDFFVDGMADGSMRVMHPGIAAQLLDGMINAVIELEWWTGGASSLDAVSYYATPLFSGIFSGPLGGSR